MEYKGLLNFKGAEIRGEFEERNPPISLPNQSPDSALLAVDIGGTLIKLVYFEGNAELKGSREAIGGQLRFVKFQTSRLDECLEFIRSKGLLYGKGLATNSKSMNVEIKATGGGAFKFADIFKDNLSVSLDKMDEMDAVVTGANFLLKKIPNESFTFMHGKRSTADVNQKNLFPYLLVNIGSGVGMIKFVGDGKQEV